MTSFTPIALIILAILVILCFVLPKRYLFLPLLFSGVFLGINQALDIASLNFTAPRILVALTLIRLIFKNEFAGLKLNPLDVTVVTFSLINFVIYVIREHTVDALVYRGGGVFDGLGCYLIMIASLRGSDSISNVIKVLILLTIPIAIMLVYEKVTQYNMLSTIWGIPTTALVRNGTVRAMGPFRSPILAGTFGATTFPLVFGLWFSKPKERLIIVIGMVCCTIITIAPGTSGGFTAYLICCMGLCFWFLRSKMRMVRWGLVAVLVGVQLTMNAPIWYIFMKLAGILGGEGWWRSHLFDSFVRHYKEWFLLGASYTVHWMPIHPVIDPNHTDITNYFIAQAVSSGIVGLFLFIKILVRAYSCVGKVQYAYNYTSDANAFIVWTLGVSLLGHTASFFSVPYFGPITIFWNLLLAMVSTAKESYGNPILISNEKEKCLDGTTVVGRN